MATYRYHKKADFDAFINQYGLEALKTHPYIPGDCAPGSEAEKFLSDLKKPVPSVVGPEVVATFEAKSVPMTTTVKVTVTPGESNPTLTDPMPLLPSELKKLTRWVRWKLQEKNGRPTKVPFQTNGYGASVTDLSTWTTYQNVVKDAVINAEQGVGFVLNDDGIVGIDLDGCRNPQTGEITEWAQSIIDACNSYREITPSGTGVRVLLRGVIPGKDKVFSLNPAAGYGDKVKIEIYSTARYFTTTGNCYFEDEDAGGLESVDLIPIYQLLHDTRVKHPLPTHPKSETADAANAGFGSSTAIVYAPGTTFKTDKYTIFKRGHIVDGASNFQITDGVGTLTYPSHSEADLGFATVLAIIHDGDEKKMEDDFRDSPMWREKWERTKQYDFPKALATAKKVKEKDDKKPEQVLTSTPNLEVHEVEEPEEQEDNHLILPASALTSSVFGDLFDQVFAPNDWCLELAMPAFISAGGVLVPETPRAEGSLIESPLVHSYTALIGGLNIGKTQVTEWSAKSVGIFHEVRAQHYTQVKFGSAEQMWKYLHNHAAGISQSPTAFQGAVLVNPDEWAHVMAKANIPDASFASALTTAFYARKHAVTLGGSRGGTELTIPFSFSIIGGIVEDEFESVMSSATIGGLYDRMTFGLAPKGFDWAYREFPYHHPLFGGKGSLSITPVPVTMDGSVSEVTKAWKSKDRSLTRIPELCVRAATIFASWDGRRILTGADMEKMWSFAMYQKAIRSLYRPNPGMNHDAVYANIARNWINTNARQWRTFRELQKGTNYHRRKLGPKACYYALKGLAQDQEIEMWVSEYVRADGGILVPNDMPADYTGTRPKVGSGLVRAVRV